MKALLKKYSFLIAVLLIAALSFLAFINGYRVGPGGIPVKAGVITFNDLPAGTVIYLDAIKEHVIEDANATFYVLPNTHSVIVDAEGFQPWHELVSISSGEERTLAPIFVSRLIVKKEIAAEDQTRAYQALYAPNLPTAQQPLSLSEGCMQVYTSQNRILATSSDDAACATPEFMCAEGTEACTPTVVMEPTEPLRNVIAYPGRDDALIVASGSTVYVLEIDPREPRFFAPLTKGTGIRVAPWSETSIIVSDEQGPRELSL